MKILLKNARVVDYKNKLDRKNRRISRPRN